MVRNKRANSGDAQTLNEMEVAVETGRETK